MVFHVASMVVTTGGGANGGGANGGGRNGLNGTSNGRIRSGKSGKLSQPPKRLASTLPMPGLHDEIPHLFLSQLKLMEDKTLVRRLAFIGSVVMITTIVVNQIDERKSWWITPPISLTSHDSDRGQIIALIGFGFTSFCLFVIGLRIAWVLDNRLGSILFNKKKLEKLRKRNEQLFVIHGVENYFYNNDRDSNNRDSNNRDSNTNSSKHKNENSNGNCNDNKISFDPGIGNGDLDDSKSSNQFTQSTILIEDQDIPDMILEPSEDEQDERYFYSIQDSKENDGGDPKGILQDSKENDAKFFSQFRSILYTHHGFAVTNQDIIQRATSRMMSRTSSSTSTSGRIIEQVTSGRIIEQEVNANQGKQELTSTRSTSKDSSGASYATAEPVITNSDLIGKNDQKDRMSYEEVKPTSHILPTKESKSISAIHKPEAISTVMKTQTVIIQGRDRIDESEQTVATPSFPFLASISSSATNSGLSGPRAISGVTNVTAITSKNIDEENPPPLVVLGKLTAMNGKSFVSEENITRHMSPSLIEKRPRNLTEIRQQANMRIEKGYIGSKTSANTEFSVHTNQTDYASYASVYSQNGEKNEERIDIDIGESQEIFPMTQQYIQDGLVKGKMKPKIPVKKRKFRSQTWLPYLYRFLLYLYPLSAFFLIGIALIPDTPTMIMGHDKNSNSTMMNQSQNNIIGSDGSILSSTVTTSDDSILSNSDGSSTLIISSNTKEKTDWILHADRKVHILMSQFFFVLQLFHQFGLFFFYIWKRKTIPSIFIMLKVNSMTRASKVQMIRMINDEKQLIISEESSRRSSSSIINSSRFYNKKVPDRERSVSFWSSLSNNIGRNSIGGRSSITPEASSFVLLKRNYYFRFFCTILIFGGGVMGHIILDWFIDQNCNGPKWVEADNPNADVMKKQCEMSQHDYLNVVGMNQYLCIIGVIAYSNFYARDLYIDIAGKSTNSERSNSGSGTTTSGTRRSPRRSRSNYQQSLLQRIKARVKQFGIKVEKLRPHKIHVPRKTVKSIHEAEHEIETRFSRLSQGIFKISGKNVIARNSSLATGKGNGNGRSLGTLIDSRETLQFRDSRQLSQPVNNSGNNTNGVIRMTEGMHLNHGVRELSCDGNKEKKHVVAEVDVHIEDKKAIERITRLKQHKK